MSQVANHHPVLYFNRKKIKIKNKTSRGAALSSLQRKSSAKARIILSSHYYYSLICKSKVISCMISRITSPFFGEDDRSKFSDATTNITRIYNNDNNSNNNDNILASLSSDSIYGSTSLVGSQNYVFGRRRMSDPAN